MAHVLDDEIAAYERRVDDLRAHYLGKFVVFHGGDLMGAYDTFDAAYRAASMQFGSEPYLVRQVGTETATFPIPASVAYRPVYANR